MEKYMFAILGVIASLYTVYSLECFQCLDVNWNHNDCTHKKVRCSQFQDACTTYIKWGVPKTWSARGDRRYYISKDCDTRQGCQKRQSGMGTACSRSWYHDWACVECCVGDLCNFYVTLGAGTLRVHWMTTIALVTASSTWLLWGRT